MRTRCKDRFVSGNVKSPTYSSWQAMLDRCRYETHPAYARYGGRGIKVCDEWRASFDAFLRDMGERPEGRTLDRINNDGGYDCGHCEDCAARGVVEPNCRWATRSEQARNTQSNLLLTFDGKTQCMTAWARELGIGKSALNMRLRHGWPLERALTEKVQQRQQTKACGQTSLRPVAPKKLVEWNGESLSIAEWARRTGISRDVISQRLLRGWPAERALSEPIATAAEEAERTARRHANAKRFRESEKGRAASARRIAARRTRRQAASRARKQEAA